MNRMVVPRCALGPTTASGDTGTPSRYSCWYSLPSRWIVRCSVSERALTTDTPTPWRPPETLYEESSNLPPGVQDGEDHLGRRDTLFRMDIDRNSTAIVGDGYRLVGVDGHRDVGAVARSASSIELSRTSNTMWCRPVPSSVSPMYIPGAYGPHQGPLRL